MGADGGQLDHRFPGATMLRCALLCIFANGLWAETIAIDAAADRHAISPLIYGVAFGSPAALTDLGSPLNRSGGNATTRYNWQQNCSNRGNDWYFQSVPEGAATAGLVVDTFIADSRAGGAQPMVTIPIIGWTGVLTAGRDKRCSFSIAKYGPQQGNDAQWFPDAGNGVKTDGSLVTGNDPTDANAAVTVSFVQDWLGHLTGRWGAAAAGGVRYFILDNEWALWSSTHRDVHPAGVTLDEMWQKAGTHAAAIRAADAGTVICGPEEWGWTGYLYSGADAIYAAAHNWQQPFPDRASHGNLDAMPWLLDQFKAYEQANGKRVLDVFTLHWYPQSGEFSNDLSDAVKAKRNRSTRSLWDPNYTDESWVNDKVQLIPRMKQWVAAHYPGTRVGITEYSWGADNDANGATVQADVLGIFGREGLDLATRWVCPETSTWAYQAMKLWRNYDGTGSGFGETSVRATVANPDAVAAFAALRQTDGALTVVVINKTAAAATRSIAVSGFKAGRAAQVWQVNAPTGIAHLADLPVAAGTVTLTAPAGTVTLLVIPPILPVVQGAFGTASGAAGFQTAADLDGNGRIDADDLTRALHP